MTQDATTLSPLQALQSTLSIKLGVPPPIDNAFVAPGCEQFSEESIAAARQALRADGLNPDAKIEFDSNGDAPIKHEDFYSALDHLEAEGHKLLQTTEHAVEVAGHTILAIGEHTLRPHPAAVAPHRIEMAQALPLARADDILHESEHAIIRAFMDAGDVLRHVYLNLHGLWVKA